MSFAEPVFFSRQEQKKRAREKKRTENKRIGGQIKHLSRQKKREFSQRSEEYPVMISKEASGQRDEKEAEPENGASQLEIDSLETRPLATIHQPTREQPAPTNDDRRSKQETLQANEPVLAALDKRRREDGGNRGLADIDTQKLPIRADRASFLEAPTTPLEAVKPMAIRARQEFRLKRGRAIFLALLLLLLILNVTSTGFSQFFGPQGWGSAFGGPAGGGPNLLNQISKQLKQHTPTPGAKVQATPAELLSEQVISALMANMTLDQKIGQMLMVRFSGLDYASELDAMINQYHVGSVIEYYPTNIESKAQLIELNQQIQAHADLPMIISIDQEGGTVDRLATLDGPEISAEKIGATGNPNQAYQQGLKDGQVLASYGFNLNLAPVVDVTNVYNNQLSGRTYGNNPTIVTQMAGEYLQGLQHGSKVLGTIKHFPGLGDTNTDPHSGLPYLTRSLDELKSVDWVPYKNLLAKGDVYSIMVTHEIVKSLDASLPASLSPKVIGVLRTQLGFKGVVITDGLTMGAILARYTLGQAAVLAILAGDDLIMDPGSPDEVARMVDSIKQALASGTITEARIDESVHRILLFKYQMGLLNVNS